MKRIKYLLILIVLLIPILANAETCELDKVFIKAITIKNQSEKVEELSKATIDNNQINLNVKFQEKGDYITYNIFMQNDSSQDYEFYTDRFNINSDYVKYEIKSKDSTIKAGEGKIIEVKASYQKEVGKEKFVSDIYQDNKAINLKLLTTDKLKNPETGINHTLFSCLCILLGCILIWKTIKEPKHSRNIASLIIITTIIVPLVAQADCQYNMKVSSNVTIEQVKKICIIEGVGECNSRLKGNNIKKRILNQHEFNTYLENTNKLDVDHDFIKNKDIKSDLETKNNLLSYKVSKNQILESNIGCYIFSDFKEC